VLLVFGLFGSLYVLWRKKQSTNEKGNS